MIATQIAATTNQWLEILAADFGVPVVELARQLHTPSALEVEIAHYIVRQGQADALHDVQMQRPPPPLDAEPTLRDRVRHAHFARLSDYLQDLRDQEAEAALDEMINS